MSLPTLSSDSNQSEAASEKGESNTARPGDNQTPGASEQGGRRVADQPSGEEERPAGSHLAGQAVEISNSQVVYPIANRPKREHKGGLTGDVEVSKHKLLRDRDLQLKLAVGAALSASAYYTRINVGLSASSTRGLADVTDIDVLGLKYDLTFSPEAMAVSCKTGTAKSLSAAKEVFYLRGVLDYVGAGTGVVAFLNKPIPSHLRDLGRRLRVLVLSGPEIETWCQSLVNGLPDPGYYDLRAFEAYLNVWTNPVNTELLAYLRTDYWFHLDFRNLQNLIGHLRRLSAKVSDRYKLLDIVVLDTAAHLCLTIFDLCHQIRMMGLPSITETTSAYLFGGTVSFKARKDLYLRVQQLLASTGVLRSGGPTLPPLEPTYTQALSELAIRFIERPHASILIPQVIQDGVWRRLGEKGMPSQDDKNSLAAEKLTQDLIDFLLAATGSKVRVKL